MAIESTVSLPADAASVSRARRFVRGLLDESGASAFEECAVLLVSELVTNAVLHTRTAPEITVRLSDGRLWVGVHDGSPVKPAPKRYGPDAATGRGLQLVDRVAASWGVERDAAGKVVWFELDDDSVANYAMAQEAALLEGFAEMDIDLGTLGQPMRLDSGDDRSAPRTRDATVRTRFAPLPARLVFA